MTRFLSNDNCECPKACEVHGGNNQVLNMMKKQKTKVDDAKAWKAKGKELKEHVMSQLRDAQRNRYDGEELVDIKEYEGSLILIFEGDRFFVIEAVPNYDGDVEFHFNGRIYYEDAKRADLLRSIDGVEEYEQWEKDDYDRCSAASESQSVKRLVQQHGARKLLEAMGLPEEQITKIVRDAKRVFQTSDGSVEDFDA